MVEFQDFEDVEEWLSPLDYGAFWEAVGGRALLPINLKAHCDGLIAGGTVPTATILKGLKNMATDKLARRLELGFRKGTCPTHQAHETLH